MNKEFFYEYFGVYPNPRELPSINGSVSLEASINGKVDYITKRYKDIFLMWSGGIDSTLAFYALVKTGIHITIVYNQNSLSEYPKLGKELLSGKFPNVDMLKTSEFNSKKRSTKPTVTGELGDQIIGSATFVNYNQEQRLRAYNEVLPEELIYGYEDIVKSKLNVDTLTTGEYLWALNFIFKYDDVSKRINDPLFFNGCDLVHFFDTSEFQTWAMNNYKTNSSYDKYRDYKMAYKDYIFSQNNDEIYRKYKIKVPSLCKSVKD